MTDFVQLIQTIERSSEAHERIEALLYYLSIASDEDKFWTLALLENKGPKQIIKTKQLKEWAIEVANISPWMFDRSMTLVGDQVETLSLILPEAQEVKEQSLSYWIEKMSGVKKQSLEEQKELIVDTWNQVKDNQRYYFNKLIVGSWKIAFPHLEIIEALSRYLETETWQVSLRLAADWSPRKTTFAALFKAKKEDRLSKPYLLTEPYLIEENSSIPDVGELDILRWMAGVQIQVIKRKGQFSIWTMEGRWITGKVIELSGLRDHDFDNFVLEGNLLAFKDQFLPIGQVHSRLKVKRATKKALEDSPLICVFHDVLELNGEDKRQETHADRFVLLEKIFEEEFDELDGIHLAEKLSVIDQKGLELARREARKHQAIGVLLRQKSGVGQKSINLWKAPVLKIKAVLLYAQRAASRRAGQYIEYTFALQGVEGLMPITKTFEGLSEEEHKELGLWIKSNTIERFGRVSSVEPEQIFELSYEGVEVSKRRKSGVVLKGVKIVKWMRGGGLGEVSGLRGISKM